MSVLCFRKPKKNNNNKNIITIPKSKNFKRIEQQNEKQGKQVQKNY